MITIGEPSLEMVRCPTELGFIIKGDYKWTVTTLNADYERASFNCGEWDGCGFLLTHKETQAQVVINFEKGKLVARVIDP